MTPPDEGMAVVGWLASFVLLLLPALVLALSFAGWFGRANLAGTVAAETARAVVLGDVADDATTDALSVADALLARDGLARADACATESCARVTIDGGLERGQLVRVSVDVRMPSLHIPFLGDVAGPRWTAVHNERVDDFRSIP